MIQTLTQIKLKK